MKDWAHFYRQQGLSIIPVKGKHPLVKWKEFQEIKPNEQEIEKWWTEWPEADIGCITGSITGRLILDIDGSEGVKGLSGMFIPPTPAVRTRRGVQYHFRFPFTEAKTTVSGLIPEVDLRGEGGYVKLPPSTCSDGTRYEWIGDMNQPLAECPKWLLNLLNTPTPSSSTIDTSPKQESWLVETLSGVSEGGRHQALCSLFGYYANTMPLEAAAVHIREWNKRNVPPYTEAELEEQITNWVNGFKNGEYSAAFKERPQRMLEIMSASNLVKNYSKPPRYLVPGLIPMASRTILSGWQGRGKSFCMTDLVIEVARKKGQGKWFGEFPVERGPVIYIDNENGANLVSYRVSQLLGPKGLKTEDLDLHFVIGHHWKMTSEADYLWLREQVKQIRPVLIVMDSLASCHNLQENESKDMRLFFDDLIAPFCEEFDCGFLCIDHEKKDTVGLESTGGKRLRGSSAKGDAVDTILSLNEKNGVVFLEHAKSRFGRKHQPFSIGIQDVVGGLVVKNLGVM